MAIPTSKMENQTGLFNSTTWPANTTNIPTSASGILHTSSSYNAKTILLVIALCLIMLVGILGNGSVCYFFGWKLRNGRSIPDRLFLYLGIVDLISAVVNPATFLYFELTRYKRWDFGVIGCKVLVPFGPISTLVSACFIQIITVDRFLVIVKPFGRTYSNSSINAAVLMAIIFSIAAYAYYILALTVPPGKTCIVKDVADKGYAIPVVVFLLLQDVTFLFIIGFTNIAIYLRMKKSDALALSETGKQQSIKRKRKLLRMLMIMAVTFMLCILPKDLFQLSYTLSWLDDDGIIYNYQLVQVNTALKILYTANSCVNVFIYSKMHTRFRNSQRFFVAKCIQCFQQPGTPSRQPSRFAPSSSVEAATGTTDSFMTPLDEPGNPRTSVSASAV